MLELEHGELVYDSARSAGPGEGPVTGEIDAGAAGGGDGSGRADGEGPA